MRVIESDDRLVAKKGFIFYRMCSLVGFVLSFSKGKKKILMERDKRHLKFEKEKKNKTNLFKLRTRTPFFENKTNGSFFLFCFFFFHWSAVGIVF
jgi:hypothetical protein